MTKQDPKKHRRSIRLRGYDYSSPGAYFVTICTQERECVLDDPIVSGIIQDVWNALPRWFPTVTLDEFVIMPNHVHFILWIQSPDAVAPQTGVGATLAVAPDAIAPDAVAPNVAAPDAVAPQTGVGATLAVAPDAVAPDAVAPDAVAPDAVAPDAVAPDAVAPNVAANEWVVPKPQRVNLNPTLGDVVGTLKSLVFKVYLDWVQTHDPTRQASFWQRNYYEHIIRNKQELDAIRDYIRQNPDRWHADRDNPDNLYRLAPPARASEYVLEAMRANRPRQGQDQQQ